MKQTIMMSSANFTLVFGFLICVSVFCPLSAANAAECPEQNFTMVTVEGCEIPFKDCHDYQKWANEDDGLCGQPERFEYNATTITVDFYTTECCRVCQLASFADIASLEGVKARQGKCVFPLKHLTLSEIKKRCTRLKCDGPLTFVSAGLCYRLEKEVDFFDACDVYTSFSTIGDHKVAVEKCLREMDHASCERWVDLIRSNCHDSEWAKDLCRSSVIVESGRWLLDTGMELGGAATGLVWSRDQPSKGIRMLKTDEKCTMHSESDLKRLCIIGDWFKTANSKAADLVCNVTLCVPCSSDRHVDVSLCAKEIVANCANLVVPDGATRVVLEGCTPSQVERAKDLYPDVIFEVIRTPLVITTGLISRAHSFPLKLESGLWWVESAHSRTTGHAEAYVATSIDTAVWKAVKDVEAFELSLLEPPPGSMVVLQCSTYEKTLVYKGLGQSSRGVFSVFLGDGQKGDSGCPILYKGKVISVQLASRLGFFSWFDSEHENYGPTLHELKEFVNSKRDSPGDWITRIEGTFVVKTVKFGHVAGALATLAIYCLAYIAKRMVQLQRLVDMPKGVRNLLWYLHLNELERNDVIVLNTHKLRDLPHGVGHKGRSSRDKYVERALYGHIPDFSGVHYGPCKHDPLVHCGSFECLKDDSTIYDKQDFSVKILAIRDRYVVERKWVWVIQCLVAFVLACDNPLLIGVPFVNLPVGLMAMCMSSVVPTSVDVSRQVFSLSMCVGAVLLNSILYRRVAGWGASSALARVAGDGRPFAPGALVLKMLSIVVLFCIVVGTPYGFSRMTESVFGLIHSSLTTYLAIFCEFMYFCQAYYDGYQAVVENKGKRAAGFNTGEPLDSALRSCDGLLASTVLTGAGLVWYFFDSARLSLYRVSPTAYDPIGAGEFIWLFPALCVTLVFACVYTYQKGRIPITRRDIASLGYTGDRDFVKSSGVDYSCVVVAEGSRMVEQLVISEGDETDTYLKERAKLVESLRKLESHKPTCDCTDVLCEHPLCEFPLRKCPYRRCGAKHFDTGVACKPSKKIADLIRAVEFGDSSGVKTRMRVTKPDSFLSVLACTLREHADLWPCCGVSCLIHLIAYGLGPAIILSLLAVMSIAASVRVLEKYIFVNPFPDWGLAEQVYEASRLGRLYVCGNGDGKLGGVLRGLEVTSFSKASSLHWLHILLPFSVLMCRYLDLSCLWVAALVEPLFMVLVVMYDATTQPDESSFSSGGVRRVTVPKATVPRARTRTSEPSSNPGTLSLIVEGTKVGTIGGVPTTESADEGPPRPTKACFICKSPDHLKNEHECEKCSKKGHSGDACWTKTQLNAGYTDQHSHKGSRNNTAKVITALSQAVETLDQTSFPPLQKMKA